MSSSRSPEEAGIYPVLPLRDIVVFPHMIVPLFVGREKSIHALEEVMGSDKQIMLATQINASDDDPEPAGIYDIGTIANVLQLLKLPDGTVKVLVEGRARAEVIAYTDREELGMWVGRSHDSHEFGTVNTPGLARTTLVPAFSHAAVDDVIRSWTKAFGARPKSKGVK